MGIEFVGEGWKKVLYKSEPREVDFRVAHAEVKKIRSGLARLRGELQSIGRIETDFWFDSTANEAAAGISLAIRALYSLVDGGNRDLNKRADALKAVWDDAKANPDDYVIEERREEGMVDRHLSPPINLGNRIDGIYMELDEVREIDEFRVMSGDRQIYATRRTIEEARDIVKWDGNPELRIERRLVRVETSQWVPTL